MAEYETEEQQVEALKEWWKQNGLAIVGGAVIGISALLGWRGWDLYQEKQATEASDIFAVVQEAVISNDINAFNKQVNNLRTNYASTPYASLAVLHQAKIQIEKEDNVVAEESLRWVLKNSKQDSVQDVARLRLARLLISDDKVEQALEMVNSVISDAYASLVNEIRGDIFVVKGELEQAKGAYDQAMQEASGGGVEYLQLKRNELGS